MTTLNHAEELEALTRALETSEQVVRGGGAIDLQGLDAQVEKLCADIIKTEGPLRLELLPKLEQLIGVLGKLESGLRHASSPQVMQAENRLRARAAYGGTEKNS